VIGFLVISKPYSVDLLGQRPHNVTPWVMKPRAIDTFFEGSQGKNDFEDRILTTKNTKKAQRSRRKIKFLENLRNEIIK